MSTLKLSVMHYRVYSVTVILLAGLLLPNRPASVYALTNTDIFVNTTTDELNNDGNCSLREAIQAANTNTAVDGCTAGGAGVTDIVHFGVAGTITLASQLSVNAGGPLLLNGAEVVTIKGGNNIRAFNVNTGASLTLESLTITEGSAETGGGIYNSGNLTILNSILSNNYSFGDYIGGGGIYNTGTVTITNSLLAYNSAYHVGGAIYNIGQVTLTNSEVFGNDAHNAGGAISNQGTLTIVDSALDENTVFYDGGGIYNTGTVSLANSTLARNSALYGGGIHSNGTVTIVNSTFSGNEAINDGGAIYNQGSGSMTLANSTITANHAGYFAGGVKGDGLGLTLRNTILADNSAGSSSPDCAVNDAHSDGYNLVGNNDGCMFLAATGDKIGTSINPIDPLLGPLQDNGGPTFTHALLVGSPATEAGNPATPGSGGSACDAKDQRGLSRPQGSRCDIGAYEYVKFTFDDVPPTYWAWNFIERLYAAGITSGCSTSPMLYCPTKSVTRDQMAVFLLRAEHGKNYVPPKATGNFSDVPVTYWAADWIEQLANEGITGGCGGGKYCPGNPVTRAQMAIFLLRAEHGATYKPPAATGLFSDVQKTDFTAPFIEQLANESITGGCGGGKYCPANPVSRDQMAVFLVRTFKLP